jgi:arylsulfatase A-like enzyme
MTTIADKLRGVGYDTVHAGKWHGGMSHAAQLPIHRGFNSSLAMLSGSADHFSNVREGFVDLRLARLETGAPDSRQAAQHRRADAYWVVRGAGRPWVLLGAGRGVPAAPQALAGGPCSRPTGGSTPRPRLT